jgi:NADPH:quinone reductase-like Zn-dependent oxidoreductase
MRRRLRWPLILCLVLIASVGVLALTLRYESPCPSIGSAEPPLTDTTSTLAFTRACYGGPEVLRLQAVPTPTPGAGELLVRVRAAAVNPLDWHELRGKPYVMRLVSGMATPASSRLGADFAGVVEAVGPGATRFRVGDRVFGQRNGAFATHVLVRDTGVLAAIPEQVSFEEAAATGVAAITALQALRDKGRVRPGHRVLINGASGGVGTYAVQIAKRMGAHVTGVASTRNVALVQSLGADRVIDYTTEDVTADTARYHTILDLVGNHPLRALDAVLMPEGVVVIVGGPNENALLGPLTRSLRAMIAAPILTGTFANFLASATRPDLELLRDWLQDGTLRSVIDRRYPLAELPAAIAYQETGRARGKVLVHMP